MLRLALLPPRNAASKEAMWLWLAPGNAADGHGCELCDGGSGESDGMSPREDADAEADVCIGESDGPRPGLRWPRPDA